MFLIQVNFDNTKFKLDSMLSQQAKLIDYLQVKVENPGKKKKVRLSGPVGIVLNDSDPALRHNINDTLIYKHPRKSEVKHILADCPHKAGEYAG